MNLQVMKISAASSDARPSEADEIALLAKSAKELLTGIQPVKPAQVANLFTRMMDQMKDPLISSEIYKDKFHPLTQLYRLAKTLEKLAEPLKQDAGMVEPEDISGSHGARLLVGKTSHDQEEPTYVCKPMNLKEYEFGVPEQGGAKREQLAYLFDKNHFAGVPPTFVVDLREYKLGICSLQHYEGGCTQFYRHANKKSVDIQALRKIAIHNLLMVNVDASSLNILVRKTTPIPIDFGYSLPNDLDKKPNIDIFKLIPEGPFNEAERAHIENLDMTELSTTLRSHGIADEAIQIQQAIVQMMQTAIKTRDITLQDLLVLFYDGERKGGSSSHSYSSYSSYSSYEQPRIQFSVKMCRISRAKMEMERSELIQIAFDDIRKSKR